MEYIDNDLFTTVVPLGLINQKPYFFIKWAKKDKRYRVSTSFKFMNTKYGLHINIIRNLTKVKDINYLNNLLYLLKQNPKTNITNDFYYYNITDEENKTEIFLIERRWDNEKNITIVFFSINYWSLRDYLRAMEDIAWLQ